MDFSALSPSLNKYKNVRGSLIAILQDAQDIYGYIPPELIEHISRETGERPAKIEGVATFYAQFKREPVGKHLIMLCRGTACHVNGSGEIFDALSAELSVTDGGTTKDGLFTLAYVACLGCCSLSPAMMVNGEAHGALTPEKAVKIINNIRAGV